MDRHTLFSMQAGLLVFLGLVIVVAYRARRRKTTDASPYWFGTAYILGGLGLAVLAEREAIDSEVLGLVGVACFLLLSPMAHKAIAITTGQRGFFSYLLGLAGLGLATCFFAPSSPHAMVRVVVVVAIILATMQLSIIYLLLRSRDEVIRVATRAMAALLTVHILTSAVRVIGAWQAQRAELWYSWTSIVTIAGAALCFLWIDNLRMSSELELQAMTDPLTGLLNRRALDMFAAREIDMAVRNQWPCSALMLDLDNFKDTNDRYGHTAGDSALVAVAGVLNSTLRTSDLITRIGGDEFFVLLPNSDESTTAFIVSRIRLAIRALCLHSPGNETFGVRISIGYATLRGENVSVAELLHAADIMLYGEKHAARSGSRVKATDHRGPGAQVHPSS